ncbi:peptidase [Cellulomonas sp. JH27-2]|uniref:peptidase n=1 Tax=Cellulomonas sp. JH27-2 TaxID=2774139 RepID=UPI00177D63A7|nr:peptidase [Cellulomonas sp. JH27-2]MBD8059505.1 peptidase [Cellulomonas sp. JH27-2]
MSRHLRAALAALAACLLVLMVPAAATAASPSRLAAASASPSPSPTVYGCLVGEDEYGAPLPCELKVDILTPICDNDVPKLQYKVTAVGSPNTTVKITWINPGGANYVQADLPLEGTILWPGAVQDSAGNAVDWPGWRLENGVWVQGDEWDWVRPSVKVLFQVNPEMTVNVAYPPSSPNCATNPPQSTPSPTPSTPGESPSTPGSSPTTPDTEVLVDNPSPSPSTPDTEVLVDNPLPPDQLSHTGSNVAPILIGAAVLVVGGVLVVLLVNRQRRRGA